MAAGSSLRIRAGAGLVVFLALVTLLAETRAGWSHLLRADWPAHARFHLMIGLFCLQLLLVSIPVLVWVVLRRGQRWALRALAVIAGTVHGGQLLADAVSGGGLRMASTASLSGEILYGLTASALLLYGVGIWLLRPALGRVTGRSDP